MGKRTKSSIEEYYLKHHEPYSSCLLALKHIIMSVDEDILHERKFQLPFFSYKGQKLAFLWMNRKKLILGFITDKRILLSNEKKVKDQLEMIEINPNEDLPKEMIETKIRSLISFYNSIL